MNRMTMLFGAVLALLVPAIACQSGGDETHTLIPVKDLLTAVGPPCTVEKAPDDITGPPGLGPGYCANFHQQGVENPWPPIEITNVVLGSGSDEARIFYRDYIETKAGEARNNVIKVTMPNIDVPDFSSLSLYTLDIPDGITLTDGLQWGGPRSRASMLVMEISPDVKAGQYTLEIGLEINGKDYGTIPGTIKVLEP